MLGEVQVRRSDRSSVYRDYEEWPRHSEDAYRLRVSVPPRRQFRQLIFVGMGGSATAGDILEDWLSDNVAIPIHVVKDSRLPAQIGPDSLVLAASVSGDTIETVRATKAAFLKKATLATLASGGLLAKFSQREGVPFTRIRGLLAPRTSLPYVLFPSIRILEELGLAKGGKARVLKAIATLHETRRHVGVKIDVSKNVSKQCALAIKGTYPVIFSSRFTKSAATRFKNSLNETAKAHAMTAIVPEAFHNEIVAWTPAQEMISAVLLRAKRESVEVTEGFEALKEIIRESGASAVDVFGFGESRLGQLVSLIYLLDYAALYVAILRGIDPLPTPQIDRVKRSLTRRRASFQD